MRLFLVLFFFFSISVHGRQWPDQLNSKNWVDQIWIRYAAQRASTYEQWVGIENEGVYTENSTRDLQTITRGALSFLKNNKIAGSLSSYEDSEGNFGERIVYFSGLEDYVLTFHHDGTIFSLDKKKPVEIASPILRNNADIKLYTSLIGNLKSEVAFQAEPINSGTHVHLSFEYPTAAETLLLSVIFSAIEAELRSLFNVQSRANEFAQPLQDFEIEYLLQQLGISQLEFQNKLERSIKFSRDRALNLMAFKKYKTAEIRLLNSTADEFVIRAFVDFSKKLMLSIRFKDPKLYDFLKGKHPDEIKLESLSKVIGAELASAQVRTYISTSTRNEILVELKLYQGTKDNLGSRPSLSARQLSDIQSRYEKSLSEMSSNLSGSQVNSIPLQCKQALE